ncbi:MAG: hypothetical protein A3C70_00130 [Candidatus Zambryskibacteria bacterium RIFCSPHIGHO2_02_FULL_43_14]|uniref:Uncharacterized protein n=1 Tax=Candidatus Zambryskibacteria bacterium RIFCSPHIGHO2_02_FULL_43_14 TaxID=1802748 RepID=A0A1G2TEZ4_9BACT|nr:MAG: hypothetical protein A2829_03180 [Candidatus Zambryskibacteria bacterium RIFCSPHIGHO2_01_FULL_43_60]OHA95856.1 MAG: hypothetical protein A3C70_00130 [Candidatus Zambryskibacteria bacterium RIFCSPHIGHO2_02_FULL_43_14]OHB03392.1 MAG: hypothetical protein A3B03_02310 [Candidatus Zambryskibacteria bacterium RIFCSPLOWO2_01_FULL_42_41]
MAEEKKSAKSTKPTKPSGGSSNSSTVEQITFLLAGLFLLGAIVSALFAYLESLDLGAPNSLWEYFLEHIWPVWKIVAAILSALTLSGIVYSFWKLRAIDIEENKIYNPFPLNSISDENEAVEPKNEQWKKVMEYTNSDNSSDWRLAIIEADVMLEKLLYALGYVGESIGDMLKSVNKNEFLTIEDAWEAHKVRNVVAHSGDAFQLNERETKRIIALFEKVFREFGII